MLGGTFATRDDLSASVKHLQERCESAVVVATFSARWLVRSLSLVVRQDGTPDLQATLDLKDTLGKSLGDATDKVAQVESVVTELLVRSGCSTSVTHAFGGDLNRPGGLQVVVGSGGMPNGAADETVRAVAGCALGSRAAAFSLETSLELAVLSELRKAADRSRGAGPSSESSSARSDALDSLMAFGHQSLGTVAIVAYEAPPQSPHRFTALERGACVGASAGDASAWMPARIPLSDELEIPDPPELGGSQFESLRPLVDHCFLSKGGPRCLVASIAGHYRAYGVPYGFDDVRRRPIGVLCLVWSDTGRALGSYELAMARMLARHLARGYDKRHTNDAVRLVTRQLSSISDLRGPSAAARALQCDSMLHSRDDVNLVAPTVEQIVRGLVDLSGAMSVTCRLISGADGAHLARFLVRLHCEGDSCATESPGQIPLADHTSSVNAWVSRTGEPVYLRELVPGPRSGLYQSPDLEHYRGLNHVRIYRDGVQCELCVPIFAERRLVGTVNLEADRNNAFDASWETVAEYAQLIGIALLEARRRISVDTVTEVGGFLDYRHRLDGQLRDLKEGLEQCEDLPAEDRQSFVKKVKDITSVVFMRRGPDVTAFGADTRISDVLTAAMASVGWGHYSEPIETMTVEPWSDDMAEVYATRVDAEAARALAFALAQALHNVRRYGGNGHHLADREFSGMFRFGQTTLGGRKSLYVAVSSTCDPNHFEHLDPQCVFRQPIDGPERVSLGAFLAGEALRRCGGSAYLRVTHSDRHDSIVDAEFSVPAA